MKKKIRVNTKILKESSIKVGDKNYEQRLRRRVTDLRRVSQMAKSAAIKAEEAGNTDLAKKLNDRVEEIEKLLATYNIDTIDTEEIKTEDENVAKEDSEKDSEEEDKDSEDNDEEESEDKDKDKDNADNKDNENPSKSEKPLNPEPPKPTTNTGPIEPNDPVEPIEPIDPIEPTEIEIDPIEPTEPTEPGEPIEPGEPTEEYPGEPTKPTEPTELGEPTEDYPGEPTKKKETDEEDEDENSEDDTEEDDSDTDTDKNNKKSKGKKDSDDDDSDDEEKEDTDTDSEKTKNTKKGSDGEEDSDDEEDDSDEEETDDSPVKDPFADEEDIPKLNLGGGMQEPRDANLKDIIKQLKGLSPEGKRGALTALQDIINLRKSTTESLTEAVKGVREMTDDEFGDYINDTYDLIDQVEVLDYEDAEELKNKKAKVGQWSTDPKTLKELEAEDDVALEKDFRKEKAREKESAKYTKAKVGTLEDFKLNFYNAIKHQVEMVIQEYQSYNEINAEYESEDVIMKADITQEVPEEVIPVIDIYFDVSASWTQADIDIGKKAIATVKEFEDAGEIKLNIFYFGDEVSSNYYEVYNGGTTAWRKVLQNIRATGAQNVLIMTDADIENIGKMGQKPWYSHYAQYGAIGGPTCKVDGCVWFLWKNGKSSPSCVDHLIGRQGNYQYAFYS